MSDDASGDEIRTLWQSQAIEPSRISLDDIRRRAQHFEKTLRRRNLGQYVGSIVVVLVVAAWMRTAPNAVACTGAGLLIAAALSSAYRMATRGATRTVPEDMNMTTCIDFYGQSLRRRRDLVRSSWQWHLLPMIPGVIVLLTGLTLAHPEHWARQCVAGAGFVVIGVVAFTRTTRAAQRYQLEIDALDAMEKR